MQPLTADSARLSKTNKKDEDVVVGEEKEDEAESDGEGEGDTAAEPGEDVGGDMEEGEGTFDAPADAGGDSEAESGEKDGGAEAKSALTDDRPLSIKYTERRCTRRC